MFPRIHQLALGADELGVRGHYVTQLGRREVQADGGDPDEKVALGEDTEQALVLDDEEAAATVLIPAGGSPDGYCALGQATVRVPHSSVRS